MPASASLELLAQFEAAAHVAAATVEQVPRSATAIAAAVRRQVPEGGRIAIADPIDLPPELFRECHRLPGVFPERSRTALSTADVGVTDAFAAIAASGSICVVVDRGYAGYISLLVRTHIAVVDSDCMVARPGELFRPDCLAGKGLRRNFVYVTGPSATADMGPLVRGVHGPHRLHVVVLV